MVCKSCYGNGLPTGAVKCPKCKGQGRLVPMIGAPRNCPQCSGSGFVKCGACGGTGK